MSNDHAPVEASKLGPARVALRVTIFLSGLRAGGTERVAVDVAGWLQQAGHRVQLLTLSDLSGDFYTCPPGMQRVGLGLLSESTGIRSAISMNWRRLRAVRRSIQAHGSEVVVSLGATSNVLMLLAALGLACRKIISERSDPEQLLLGRVWAVLRRLSYRKADLHISQSSYASDWIAKRFPRLPCQVIGNSAGMSSAAKTPMPGAEGTSSHAIRLIAVGSLRRVKGMDLLLTALALARPHFECPVTLAICGDGPERGALAAQAMELGLTDSVKFLGSVVDVQKQYRDSNLFVLPSRMEGFPNALVEAMACGLPAVVASCPGGVREVVGGASEAFAVEVQVGDASSLAIALAQVVNSLPLREQFAAAAKRRAEEYSEEKIATAWRFAVEQC